MLKAFIRNQKNKQIYKEIKYINFISLKFLKLDKSLQFNLKKQNF